MSKQRSKKLFKAPKFKPPGLSKNFHLPEIDYSSYTYSYNTTLDAIPKYLRALGIKTSPDSMMCVRMGWWYDYYREVSKLDGIRLKSVEEDYSANALVILEVAKSLSKLRVPSNLDTNTCKSIW